MVKIKKERGSAATEKLTKTSCKKRGQTLPDPPMAWITK